MSIDSRIWILRSKLIDWNRSTLQTIFQIQGRIRQSSKLSASSMGMASLSGVFRVGDCIFWVHFLKDFSFGRILFGVHVSNYWWFAFCLGRLFRLINLSTKWGFETARIHSIHGDATVDTHSFSYIFYHVKKCGAGRPVWALECWHDVLGLEKQMLSSVTAGRMIPRWSGSSSKSCSTVSSFVGSNSIESMDSTFWACTECLMSLMNVSKRGLPYYPRVFNLPCKFSRVSVVLWDLVLGVCRVLRCLKIL